MSLPNWRDALLKQGLCVIRLLHNLVCDQQNVSRLPGKRRKTPPSNPAFPDHLGAQAWDRALRALPNGFQHFTPLVIPTETAWVPVPCLVTGPWCVFFCHLETAPPRQIQHGIHAVRHYLYRHGYHGEVVRVPVSSALVDTRATGSPLAQWLQHYRPLRRSNTPGWAAVLLRTLVREPQHPSLPGLRLKRSTGSLTRLLNGQPPMTAQRTLPRYFMRDQSSRINTLQPIHQWTQQVLQRLIAQQAFPDDPAQSYKE